MTARNRFFAATILEGQAMTLDQAIELALTPVKTAPLKAEKERNSAEVETAAFSPLGSRKLLLSSVCSPLFYRPGGDLRPAHDEANARPLLW